MICTECGLVVGDRVIDVSSEWRTFSNDKESKEQLETPSRTYFFNPFSVHPKFRIDLYLKDFNFDSVGREFD